MSDLKEHLRQSLELTNLVDLEVERAERGLVPNAEVTPETLLRLALKDCELAKGRITKCYVTLIEDEGDSMSTTNMRANLTRTEEIAYRQLGLTEAIESWRGR